VCSPPLLDEAPDELRDLIRCGIEREMTRIEDMEFGLRHVAAIGFRFRKLDANFFGSGQSLCPNGGRL
jgi:hypothetical protein